MLATTNENLEYLLSFILPADEEREFYETMLIKYGEPGIDPTLRNNSVSARDWNRFSESLLRLLLSKTVISPDIYKNAKTVVERAKLMAEINPAQQAIIQDFVDTRKALIEKRTELEYLFLERR